MTRCHTQEVLDQLPDEQRVDLNAALAAKHVSTGQIVGVLGDHGFSVRAENVNRHRRRIRGENYACKCPLTEKATA